MVLNGVVDAVLASSDSDRRNELWAEGSGVDGRILALEDEDSSEVGDEDLEEVKGCMGKAEEEFARSVTDIQGID